MMGKLEFKYPTLAHAAQVFLEDPSKPHEDAVLDELNKALAAEHYAPLIGAFIEWGCVEHGVIHVFARSADIRDCQSVLEINPDLGSVQEVL